MKGLSASKKGIQYFDITDKNAHIELGKCIIHYMETSDVKLCTPVILCIGTDRATGDCLGPLVGEQLQDYSDSIHVMGCLSTPVHALNIKDAVNDIHRKYERPFVIAIDASLGSSSHVGLVTINDGPLCPGKGVQKKLPAIGDISITGIVNVSGGHPGLLQSTRLYTVMQLANCIANALKYSIHYLESC